MTVSAGTSFAVVSDEATLAGQLYAAGMRAGGDDAESDEEGAAPLPAVPVLQRLTLVRSDVVLEAVTQSPARGASIKAEVHAAQPAAEGKRKVRCTL